MLDIEPAQREKIQETLIHIANVSKTLTAAIARSNASGMQFTSARTRLDKIIATSKAILAKLLDEDASLDPGLEDWLGGKEPPMCLWTLKDMEKLIPVDSSRGISFGRAFIRAVNSIFAEAKINEAIYLFNERGDIFYFLLTPEIWDRAGTSMQAQPETVLVEKVNQSHPNHALTPINFSPGAGREAPHISVPSVEVEGMEGDIDGESTKEPRSIDPKKLDSLLQWLDGFSCHEKYGDVLRLHQRGTCKWFPETKQYKEWKNGEDSFLWLQGKPGSGKTVLATSVIETIKQGLQDGEYIAFFYCDFRNERTTSAAGVMRSILSQLLHKLCHSTGRDLIQLIDDLVKEKTEGTSILKHADGISPFVTRTARQFRQQPFVVIDALDECQDLENLLRALRELSGGGGTRLFVTCRPLQIIKDDFYGLPFLSMDRMTTEVSADIKLHITREVEGDRWLRILDKRLKKDICVTLERGADGMFRWTQCQIDTLKKCRTTRDIRKALDSLPIGLEETYERILRGMDPLSIHGQLAKRALPWLVAALRSLHLAEIIEALSIDFKARRIDRELAPIHGPALLDVLGSLVVYNEETDVIDLSHFTVKEYLVGSLSRETLPMHHVDLQVAHVEVLRLCMGYITAMLRHPQLSEADKVLHTSSDQPERGRGSAWISSPKLFPLLSYVFFLGFDHLKHLESVFSLILDDLVTLRLDIQRHPTEWAQICKLVRSYFFYFRWLSPEHDFVIYVLISLLPAQSLHTFLYYTPSFKPFDRTSPLVYATHMGKIEQARTLLSCGINICRSGWDVKSARELLLPLEVAFYGRHLPLFDLFLKHWRAPVPLRLFSTLFGEQDWWYYDRYMIVAILQCDEFAEWAAQGQHREMLLSVSNLEKILGFQEQDIIAILRRLLQVGCDLSLPEFLPSTLHIIWHAMSKSQPKLLGFLCSQNAPVPSRILSIQDRKPAHDVGKPTLAKELVSQGHDLGTIVTNGNLEFKHVFGNCKRGSSCWMPDCSLCSVFLKFTPCDSEHHSPVHILFIGRTGAGKGTLIDLITCVPGGLPGAVQVDDSSSGSTLKPIGYATLLQDLPLQIWDVPGFDETSDYEHIKSSVADWIQHASSNQVEHDQGKSKPTSPIVQVVWCMHASDIHNWNTWDQFRAAYEECHSRGILLSFILNQVTSTESESPTEFPWLCRALLEKLYWHHGGAGPFPRFLMSVRSHHDSSSFSYEEDCLALRDIIYRYVHDLRLQQETKMTLPPAGMKRRIPIGWRRW